LGHNSREKTRQIKTSTNMTGGKASGLVTNMTKMEIFPVRCAALTSTFRKFSMTSPRSLPASLANI
jgi:hypothetical protein